MPTPASWTKEAAKILDRENRRMTTDKPATAAGRAACSMTCCVVWTIPSWPNPDPAEAILAIEAEAAADQSGLRAALEPLFGWGRDAFYINRLREEVAELEQAIAERQEPRRVWNEAADVANFAAMLADRYEARAAAAEATR